MHPAVFVLAAAALLASPAGPAAPRSPPAADAPAEAPFQAPLGVPLDVVRAFQAPLSTYGAGHRGADFAAAPGSLVLAAGPGVVTFAGRVVGRYVVSIAHLGGLRTTYEPMAAIAVRPGQTVAQGAVIGTLAAGHPGCLAPKPLACLHWGALRNGVYFNPLGLLAAVRVRLLTPLALLADHAVAVGERAGGAVRADGGHRDDRVGALGDPLRPGVRVEVGGGVARIDRVDADVGQEPGIDRGQHVQRRLAR